MVTDESGKETRQYDQLGNVSHTEKTPVTLSPSIRRVTYKMDYAYDQLGRVQTMTYPGRRDDHVRVRRGRAARTT